MISAELTAEAVALDASDTNRSNVKFSRLSQKIAFTLVDSGKTNLPELEKAFTEAAAAWKKDPKTTPFCNVEGIKYAVDLVKFMSIEKGGLVVIGVPFYMEFERGVKATEENPNGEESAVQKIEEALFLLSKAPKMKIRIIFCNDSIAEKKDEKDGGSAKLFKNLLIEYSKEYSVPFDAAFDDTMDTFTMMKGALEVLFTSVGAEAAAGGDDKVKRLENRGPDGKLRERKGGAVLAALEKPLPAGVEPTSAIRCLVDGDSAHPIGSFIGDAAYSVLQLGNMGYLGNLKHTDTCVSVVGADAGGGDDATQARVQNRKLFFSGFIVPFLFPELTNKYGYKGTVQLPVKAFRGDIDFAAAALTTVQPNVDLGMLALLVSTLNTKGGTIDSGAVTIRDNIASSTMTTSDLGAEWTKTYGPIFTSAVGLCRTLKPDDFKTLPEWLTTWIEGMNLDKYTALFGDSVTAEVSEVFVTMKKFREDPSTLDELKTKFETAKLL